LIISAAERRRTPAENPRCAAVCKQVVLLYRQLYALCPARSAVCRPEKTCSIENRKCATVALLRLTQHPRTTRTGFLRSGQLGSANKYWPEFAFPLHLFHHQNLTKMPEKSQTATVLLRRLFAPWVLASAPVTFRLCELCRSGEPFSCAKMTDAILRVRASAKN
jgi:hypothetical protein